MQIKEGWLIGEGIHRKLSPNFDLRPVESGAGEISLLVIHNISLPPGEFGGGYIDQLFTNSLDASVHAYFEALVSLRVSAHLLIDRHGSMTQYVSFLDRAWHAGASQFDGREKCNDFSIGIELEGADDQPYAEVQYKRLAETCRCLLKTYPEITVKNVVGHCDIAPGRKTDPGASFDWNQLHQLLVDNNNA